MTYLPFVTSGQGSWLQIQRSRVPFPMLPDFVTSRSLTGSNNLREDNWGIIWMKKWRILSRKPTLMALETSGAEYVTTLYPSKLALTSLSSGGHPLLTVRLRTTDHRILIRYERLQAWKLPDSSESKTWSWHSKPRITALTKTNSNLAASLRKFSLEIILLRLFLDY
jgi:hypothetical protein